MRLVRLFVSTRRARKLKRQRKKISINSLKSKKKGQDLIQYVPSQVMVEILSRLPIISIMRCKCVCKSWLDLIKSDEFVNSHMHLSKSSIPAGLAVFEKEYVHRPSLYVEFGKSLLSESVYGSCPSSPKEFVELVDGVDLNCRWKIDLKDFNAPRLQLHSCANGLLFFFNENFYHIDVIGNPVTHHTICNPVTREYLMLPSPPQPSSRPHLKFFEYYGFGVSRRRGQYKVVWILVEETSPDFFQCQCHVYTVGSGCKWRSIASPSLREYDDGTMGAFLEGNLHCLYYDVEGSCKGIYCIDLEAEVFSAFSAPPNLDDDIYHTFRSLSVLRDCLCACDNPITRLVVMRLIYG